MLMVAGSPSPRTGSPRRWSGSARRCTTGTGRRRPACSPCSPRGADRTPQGGARLGGPRLGRRRVERARRAGLPVPTGTVGEIWARTDGAATGYWRDESAPPRCGATAGSAPATWGTSTRRVPAAHRPGPRHHHRQRDHPLRRAHRAGARRPPRRRPGVRGGAPDERTGEAVHAFVVPAEEGHAPDLAELRALVAAQLGDASVPATITIVPEVPLGPAGKPDKRALLGRLGVV
ncbi:hypothetical protein NKH77_27375 [Streptomyces sp. M19]